MKITFIGAGSTVFARKVIGQYGRVDVLVNNAPPAFCGIDTCSYEQFADIPCSERCNFTIGVSDVDDCQLCAFS